MGGVEAGDWGWGFLSPYPGAWDYPPDGEKRIGEEGEMRWLAITSLLALYAFSCSALLEVSRRTTITFPQQVVGGLVLAAVIVSTAILILLLPWEEEGDEGGEDGEEVA